MPLATTTARYLTLSSATLSFDSQLLVPAWQHYIVVAAGDNNPSDVSTMSINVKRGKAISEFDSKHHFAIEVFVVLSNTGVNDCH